MKNINQVEEGSSLENEFITAEALRDLTLTPEELHEIAKENICNDFMGNMVKAAASQGRHFYQTIIDAAMNENLRNDIVQQFENLGYKVIVGKPTDSKQIGKKVIILTFDWSPVKKSVKEKSEDVSN